MADWIMWLIAAGVLVALELFSGTFYLLMMALGMYLIAASPSPCNTTLPVSSNQLITFRR